MPRPLGTSQGVSELGQLVGLYLSFLKTPLVFTVATRVCDTIDSQYGFSFPCICDQLFYWSFPFVLICIPHIVKANELWWGGGWYFLTIFFFLLLKTLLKSQAHFRKGYFSILFCFLILYRFWILIHLAKFFSHFGGFLFTQVIVSLTVQRLSSFIRSHLPIVGHSSQTKSPIQAPSYT